MFQRIDKRLRRKKYEREESERLAKEQDFAQKLEIENLRQRNTILDARQRERKFQLEQDNDRRRFEESMKQKQQEEKEARLGASTPEAIRDLRHQIKERYQLDCLIWSLKGARVADRAVGEDFMVRADAILDEIQLRVYSWRQEDWTPEEWEKARDIRERVKRGGKRRWKNNPPWNDTVAQDEWEM
ncbi:hypothetical protein D0Z07_8511 [Hyphodiscus hymeniophilus]|uniref:Uncharacterized protein n=1 Tax=Hyphodiscus hymeniophilus TaxID=353542 RepID=A0A9P6VCE9_9HELO|nr:hypothetical protein D0Z07_8511 [Hyphodiscus hymeniophilus]